MKGISIQSRIKLNNCAPMSSYSAVATDGNKIYLLLPQKCLAIAYNMDFSCSEEKMLQKPFNVMCFDSAHCCFYAMTYCNPRCVYVLNLSLQITCEIELQGEFCELPAKSITFNCCANRIIISFGGEIIEANLDGCIVDSERGCSSIIRAICSVCPYFIFVSDRHNGKCVTVKRHDKFVECMPLTCADNIIAIAPAVRADCEKGYIYLLSDIDSCCNQFIVTVEVCLRCIAVDRCNLLCCGECSPCGSCNDIMQSIALIEASIAHILNAEGEKLQKILAVSDDPKEILCVNNSINRTINKVTHLEHVLYNKLDILGEICAMQVDACKGDSDERD